MKLTFLGTGAADWILKKKEEVEEYRRFCSALIDDTLLIDPGPQVMDALDEYNKDAASIKYILCTHKHGDHWSPDTVAALEAGGAVLYDLRAGETKSMGKYTVRAYEGNHSTCAGTVHFIISDGERTLFYGLDSAWLLYDEVQGIIEHKPNFAVLDATIGEIDGDYRIFEHNNLAMILEMKKTLDPYVEKFCISHMALTLHTDHKTLAEKMEKHGILTACDGLEVEI